MAKYRIILVSGLTAAGKITHAKLLAEDLGWSYVSMASVRKDLLGDRLDHSEFDREWTPSHDLLRATDASIDLRADQQMTAIVTDRSNIVVDAWLQPWLYRGGDALRIWLASTIVPDRGVRTLVSMDTFLVVAVATENATCPRAGRLARRVRLRSVRQP